MKPKMAIKKYRIQLLFVLGIIFVFLVSFIGFMAFERGGVQYIFQKETNQDFDKEFKLRLNETAVLKNGTENVRFRFTHIEAPSNPDAKCDELCSGWLPSVHAELIYSGKVMKGAVALGTGTLDMSYEENGDYSKIPYVVEVLSTDYSQHSASVRITKKNKSS